MLDPQTFGAPRREAKPCCASPFIDLSPREGVVFGAQNCVWEISADDEKCVWGEELQDLEAAKEIGLSDPKVASDASQLADLRNRVYATHLRSFLTADPLGSVDSYGLFNYVAGDPVNFRDPWGLKATGGDGGGDDGELPESFESWCEKNSDVCVQGPKKKRRIADAGGGGDPDPDEPEQDGLDPFQPSAGPVDPGCGGCADADLTADALIDGAIVAGVTALTPAAPAAPAVGVGVAVTSFTVRSGIKFGPKIWRAAKVGLRTAWVWAGKKLGWIKCFVAGTLVLMADGSWVPIEEIEAGDLVMADDPNDDEVARGYVVTGLIANFTHRVVEVELGGGGIIEATGEHPFWVAGKGWVAADSLQPGDSLLDDQSDLVEVVQVTERSEEVETYNLSVAGVHTFFVVAGGEAVLVHNIDPFEVEFSRKVSRGEVFQKGAGLILTLFLV